MRGGKEEFIETCECVPIALGPNFIVNIQVVEAWLRYLNFSIVRFAIDLLSDSASEFSMNVQM